MGTPKSKKKSNKELKNSTSKKKRSSKTHSPESLKPHHAKPFRKRHFGLLIGSLVSLIILLLFFASTSLANSKAVKEAKRLISSTLNIASKSESVSPINSSYGFSLSYDQNLLYASGLESPTNRLYVGPELATSRAYNAIRIGQSISDAASAATSGSMGIEYHYDNPVGDSADLAKLEAQYVGAQNKNFAIVESFSSTTSSTKFLKSEWQSKPSKGIGSSLQSNLTSYVGVVNGAPLTIVINYGLSDNKEVQKSLDNAVESLRFNDPTEAPVSSAKGLESESSLSLLDKLMMTGQASAAAPAAPSSSEKISTLYGPSVVKIYNVYCMDVTLNGQLLIQDACSGATGSGFFIGNDGNIATNGHVAVNSPLDIAILFAFDKLSKGDSTYFDALVTASQLTQAEVDAGSTNQEQLAIIIEKFYSIPDSVISSSDKVENILIGLGEKQPDTEALLSKTKARELYPEEDTIKQAKLVAYDYRAVDGADIGAFKASDVAILKIEGSGYPSTKIGNISSLTQGSGLSIIGYPGAASSNRLVESTESRATLTSGKVSSIKSASGSSSQLIETDATIGHGNSGGPAFNDSGEVVGIATYTIDGSGEGNGVFNYVRDIADFSTLASKNSVDTGAANKTQEEWQKGVDFFYQARYSKALKQFAAVKALYPQHPKADQLSTLAQQKISAGEEIKDFPILIVVISAFVSTLLVILAIFLIIRHHKRHKAYKEQVLTQQQATANSTSLPNQVPETMGSVPLPQPAIEPTVPPAPTPSPVAQAPQQAPTSPSDPKSVPPQQNPQP